MISRFYPLLSRIPLAGAKIKYIQNYMQNYYPGDEKKAAQKAVKLFGGLCLVYLSGGIYIFATQSLSLCELCLSFCTLMMVSRYVRLKTMEKEERKLLEGLEGFIGELRFQYSYFRRMDEALEETINRQEGMIYLHGRKLLMDLENEEIEENDLQNIPSRFLALLYVLCKSTFEYGDKEIDGKSICLSGLGVIKEGIQTELLKKKKIEHLFSGLLVTCILPLAFVKIIEIWAIGNMEELKIYYQGGYGMVTTLLLCVISLFCYYLIQRWQYDVRPLPADRRWLSRLLKCSMIDKLLSWQINRNYEKHVKKHRVLKECGVRENVKQYLLLQYITAAVVFLLISAGLLQYKSMCRKQVVAGAQNMIQNLYQLQEKQKLQIYSVIEQVITGKEDLDGQEWELTGCPDTLRNTIIAEIKKGRARWSQWHYPWLIWFLPAIGGILAYFLRYRLLLLKRQYTGLKREEEILVFQSVILFLMHLDNISGEEIMQWLEKLAFYFKDSIVHALYRLVYQDYEEAETIREKEGYIPMAMILEGIIACDLLPVEEAFLQMESDYHYMEDKYRQESESYIEDQSAVSRILAFMPLYMTVGLKLIVPFVLEGLSQLSAYSESMKQFM